MSDPEGASVKPLNVMADVSFFGAGYGCPDGHRHKALVIRFFFDPDDVEDHDDVVIPAAMIRPFLVAGWDALHLLDEVK